MPTHTPQKKPGTPRPPKSTAHSLVEKDTAEYLGMSSAWLRLRRRNRDGPAFIKIGRAIRYRIADLDAFLEQHRVSPRSADAGDPHADANTGTRAARD